MALFSFSCPANPVMSSELILIVEDNPVNQKVAQMMLKRIGFDSDVADNGKIATELLTERYYPLVLMDAQMPVMDGITATRWIRAELPAERQPRIVVMTASLYRDAKGEWDTVAIDGWAEKPIKLEQFEKLIREVLSRTESKLLSS